MPLPGWHDYHSALTSLNRWRFHCWAESQSDWLRRVLLRPDSLQGLQLRQCNSVDDTACAEFSGHGDRSFMNMVRKQETLSDFLRHTMTKNSSNTKIPVSDKNAYDWKIYDAFRKGMSAHELKHRFNGDESRCWSTHYVHGRISVFLNKNLKTKHESKLVTLKHAPDAFYYINQRLPSSLTHIFVIRTQRLNVDTWTLFYHSGMTLSQEF